MNPSCSTELVNWFFMRMLRQTSRTWNPPEPDRVSSTTAAPAAVAGRHEHAVVADHDRLPRVDVVVRLPGILPQHVAAIRRQAHDPRRAEDQNLPDARERDEHRRRVRLLVVQRRPRAFPGAPIVRHDGLPVRSAGQDHDGVVDDERRRGHAPLEIRRAAVLEDVRPPHERAGRGVQAPQLAQAAQRDTHVRRPRSASRADRRRPSTRGTWRSMRWSTARGPWRRRRPRRSPAGPRCSMVKARPPAMTNDA